MRWSYYELRLPADSLDSCALWWETIHFKIENIQSGHKHSVTAL